MGVLLVAAVAGIPDEEDDSRHQPWLIHVCDR